MSDPKDKDDDADRIIFLDGPCPHCAVDIMGVFEFGKEYTTFCIHCGKESLVKRKET